jgi:hypothetical protein
MPINTEAIAWSGEKDQHHANQHSSHTMLTNTRAVATGRANFSCKMNFPIFENYSKL